MNSLDNKQLNTYCSISTIT